MGDQYPEVVISDPMLFTPEETLFDHARNLLRARSKVIDPADFNIVFFGDSWYGDGHASNYVFEDCLREAALYNPLFILHGGDIVFSGTEPQLQFFSDRVRTLLPEIPLFVTVGNHETDGVGGPTTLFQRIIGPLHFSLDLPRFNLTLIALNNLDYKLTPSELQYLHDRLCCRRRTTLVSMHIPPKGGLWKNSTYTFTEGAEMFFRLIRNKVSRVLVSHIHAFGVSDIHGTEYILSGGGGASLEREQINHIVVLRVKNGRITFAKVPTGLPAFP